MVTARQIYIAMVEGLNAGMDIPYFDNAGKRIGTIVQVEYDGQVRATVRTAADRLELVTISS